MVGTSTDEQNNDSGSSSGSDETTGAPDPGPSQPTVEAMPSPGCSGGSGTATIANSVITPPDNYDGSTPVPVLFAFHGAGGNASSLQAPFASAAKSRGYLAVFLKSQDSAWNPRADTPALDAAFDTIGESYCVDLNRVFAVGHSSGAQMITQLLCAGESRFRAVAPVASSKYCNGWDATAAIVIHGVDDIERGGQGLNRYNLDDGDGRKDFAVYHDSNECTEASTPFEPGGGCGPDIHPGCVEYDDCSARTVFCNHDDPQYGTSNHGVPCFASQVMFDFFDEF
jgi:polyhydroxybutyrate depolymerase